MNYGERIINGNLGDLFQLKHRRSIINESFLFRKYKVPFYLFLTYYFSIFSLENNSSTIYFENILHLTLIHK